MSLSHLKITDIRESHLQVLVNDRVAESKTVEYKQAIKLKDDEIKREFLSDVTALANTDGGDLIFGIKEAKGVASELVGLHDTTADDLIGRMENLLRDSVEPRISGLSIQPVPLATGSFALVIRVPRSFAAPHMVNHSGVVRFCGRNSNGKYDLDVHQLRSAFAASETLGERVKAFRLDRINRIMAGNTPVPLSSKHLIVMHVLPVVGVRPDMRLSSETLRTLEGNHYPKGIGSTGWDFRMNFDGLLIPSRSSVAYHSYAQVMRNGFIESAESEVLTRLGNNFISGDDLEWVLVNALASYLKTLNQLDLPPPFAVSVSLLNVQDFRLKSRSRSTPLSSHPIDRSELLTDEVLLESSTTAEAVCLKPIFDQIWNAGGWACSPNYDSDGNWIFHSNQPY